jgi:hypothetical protein
MWCTVAEKEFEGQISLQENEIVTLKSELDVLKQQNSESYKES